jgi:Trypsin-like peptidase domain
MQESLDASLVRIHTADGRVVGAGFLVGEWQVLTCAHVISQALELADYASDPPQGAVALDFPLIAPRTPCTAKVVQWCPPLADGRGDIAGLELQDEPPTGAEIVRFASAGDVWEHPFRAFGFPAGYDDGVWATGRLLGRQATDWVMIEDVKAQGFTIAPGFSGTPVWDTQAQGVVGMVVAASRPTETKTAFVIPLDVLAAAWPLMAVPQGEPRNPYKGLRPFTQRDAADFFGREAAVEKAAELVNSLVTDQPASSSTRLLTILGPSGAGKSSLVMAGLLPQLQHGVLPGSKEWAYLDPMVPSKRPIEALASTLKPYFPDTSFKTLREDLEDEAGRGLHLFATQLAKQRGNRVVLLIDQCEELFTQTESEDERQRFIRLLLTACSEQRGPLVALLTLRADFYDRPMQYPELFHLIDTQHLSLLGIEPDDLRRVIEQPAALSDVQLTFEGDLVNRLLADVQGQVGALPLLQFTLDQLFRRRSGRQLTLSAYRELGGVKGALTRKAEETYTALPSDEHRRLSRALFVRLIDPGASEQDTTRRRAALSEFSLADATQTRLLQEVADAYIAARLLTTNEISGITTIEVSHEALIREWPRLAGWLREAREDIRLQQTISEESAGWELHNKPGDRLYRGSRLKEAQAWAKRNPSSKQEHAFLQASAARQVRAFIALGAVMLLVVTLSGIAGWFFLNQAHTPNYVTTTDESATGSLRWAIGAAHAKDTITFDPSMAGQTIVLQNADIHIVQKNLTIQGPIPGHITIREIGVNLIIDPSASVTISGVAFQGSNTKDQPALINNQGKLTLKNCTVSGNTVAAGLFGFSGGGILNSGTIIMANSTVSGNAVYSSFDGYGGGIFNSGTIIMANSIISSNAVESQSGGSGGGGGGIYNGEGTITMTNSTISGNTASSKGDDSKGGGIYNSKGMITMTNSTVSGNIASSGGGIYSEGLDNSTTTTLIFCTIVDNSAPDSDEVDIANSTVNPSLSLVYMKASIIGGKDAQHTAIAGVITSGGYNVIQHLPSQNVVSKTAPNTDRSVNDLTSVLGYAPLLQENGGPTQTYRLVPGEGDVALNAVPQAACTDFQGHRVPTDQRGMQRPGKKKQSCDSGAYEYQTLS